MKTISATLLCALVLTTRVFSQQTAPTPIPLMQAIPLPHHEVSFQRDGVEITRFHFDPQDKRPFLFPIIGPSGHALTRMGHPHDPVTHSHHNSVWISHHDVNGVDFWGDTSKARIVCERVERLDDGDDEASITTVNSWNDGEKTLLTERRKITAQPLADKEWLLIIDSQFEAKSEAVTFGKTPFGLVAVRMAKWIGVKDGGGTIRNSEGGVNEKGVFWKPARWCDYSGRVTNDTVEGITLFDHPSNPNHPTVFHVRDDGWMGASLTFDGPRTVEPGKPLALRYALYIHAGMPKAEDIDKRWKIFSETKPNDWSAGAKH